jgi:predicted nucleic-acid-binding protein
MNGLDTNILVRYITQDNENQALLAEKAIQAARSQNEKLLIQPIVICEVIWALESAYGFKKLEILPVIDQLLRTAQLKIVDKDVCWKAFAAFSQKEGDFADYYNGRANVRDGADVTLTFDKALNESDLFLILSAS